LIEVYKGQDPTVEDFLSKVQDKVEGDDEDDEEERMGATIELPPIAMEYIQLTLQPFALCNFDLLPPEDPDFIAKMTEKYVSPQNPKELFKIIEKSGKGGFGRVYLARENKSKGQSKIAIKRMPHTTKKEMKTNFREVQFLSAIKNANIVKYVKCFQTKDELWMVMEFMEGGSLKEAGNSHQFNESQIAYIASECLQALAYLHENGLVHRDLKPGNIMLTVSGVVKLIDFGLCEEIKRVVDAPRMVGSPYWMPPEIVVKAPYNEKVDVWSLGVTLLQLIDRRGFDLGNAIRCLFVTATEGRTSPFSQDNLSGDLRDFISLMLIKDVQHRPTVAQLLQHKFLQKADTRKTMENIVSQIFISNVVGLVTGL